MTGHDRMPDRYTRASGRETIDTIRDLLGDRGFIAWCIGTAVRYRHRIGKKANTDDVGKAEFYEQMGLHMLGNAVDPRIGRDHFEAYERAWTPEDDIEDIDFGTDSEDLFDLALSYWTEVLREPWYATDGALRPVCSTEDDDG